jgi:hypothetical protein
MTPTEDDLKRLGQQVRAARRRAGFEKRQTFADHVKITARVLADIETGTIGRRKHGFSPDTLDAIEQGLGWEIGTCAAILAGQLGPTGERTGDPVKRAIEESELTPARQYNLIGRYYELLDEQATQEGRRGA